MEQPDGGEEVPEDAWVEPPGFKVEANRPKHLIVYIPEFVVSSLGTRIESWRSVLFKGKTNPEHPAFVQYTEEIDTTDDEEEEPASFFKRVGSRLDREHIVPDIIKGASGKKFLGYLTAIALATAFEEATRLSYKAKKKREQ